MSLPPHLFRGPWKKYSVIKIPLAPFYPPLFCPRQARDQRNVDSPSAAVRAAARGLLYGQEQMAVAQVDPPTTPLLGLLLGPGGATPLPLPPTTTPGELWQNLVMVRPWFGWPASCIQARTLTLCTYWYEIGTYGTYVGLLYVSEVP